MSELTILLVDDHPVVREGYRRLLERTPGYRVVAEADDATSAYQAYQRTKPDVVIMDLSLPGVGGIEALRHIRQWDRDARILIFTMHGGAGFALKAFEAGATGYVTKGSDAAELVRSVAVVAQGGRVLSNDVAREIAVERLAHPHSPLDELGPRESEILRLIASGWSAEEISASLHLSLKTVRNYHYQIKAKVGARTDAHLVWLAVRAGLIQADADAYLHRGDAAAVEQEH
ncbi:response regulator transcription factor [Bradyrhizobium sp. WD16]|uniref:response regulator n=1 Tax=Bradyrhizobium sp. WD16 TaxID=1521768 RepID=UPI0020A2B52F|nr:response regulator transcription factor [Bradyrhizobium sp. WD16]UTD28734.1 DNA-binding response regulator [Bradyrhizobium sp. WD16]